MALTPEKKARLEELKAKMGKGGEVYGPPAPGLSDAQKARFAELKAKMEPQHADKEPQGWFDENIGKPIGNLALKSGNGIMMGYLPQASRLGAYLRGKDPDQRQAEVEADLQRAQKETPIASTLGTLFGGAANAALTGAPFAKAAGMLGKLGLGAKSLGIARGAQTIEDLNTVGRLAAPAAMGASQGAATGFAYNPGQGGDINTRLSNASGGAKFGGALGAGAQALGGVLKLSARAGQSFSGDAAHMTAPEQRAYQSNPQEIAGLAAQMKDDANLPRLKAEGGHLLEDTDQALTELGLHADKAQKAHLEGKATDVDPLSYRGLHPAVDADIAQLERGQNLTRADGKLTVPLSQLRSWKQNLQEAGDFNRNARSRPELSMQEKATLTANEATARQKQYELNETIANASGDAEKYHKLNGVMENTFKSKGDIAARGGNPFGFLESENRNTRADLQKAAQLSGNEALAQDSARSGAAASFGRVGEDDATTRQLMKALGRGGLQLSGALQNASPAVSSPYTLQTILNTRASQE